MRKLTTDTAVYRAWTELDPRAPDYISVKLRLQRDWEELQRLRNQGYLTDTTRVARVNDVLKEVARIHGIRVEIVEPILMNDGVRKLGRYWYVGAKYAGVVERFDSEKWDGFIEAASDEVWKLEW